MSKSIISIILLYFVCETLIIKHVNRYATAKTRAFYGPGAVHDRRFLLDLKMACPVDNYGQRYDTMRQQTI